MSNIIIDFIMMSQFMKLFLTFIIWFLAGLLVLKKGVKVNYTRKINHFSLMFIPFFMDMILKRASESGASKDLVNDIIFSSLGLLLGLVYLFIFVTPIRERSSILKTAFASIDRPEDRPNTLLWITTQTAANFVVTIPFFAYLLIINKMELIFIVILINGFGDGLAEPVGIRFGKHHYETYALFTNKKYKRTIEGSMCVFIVSIITIMLFQASFTQTQFLIALVAIPIIMTLAEALAPHSLDNPFLSLVGQVSLILIIFI